MTTLADLLPTLPDMPWPEAQAQSVVVPVADVPALIEAQEGAGIQAVFPLVVDPASFAIGLDMVKFAQQENSGMAPAFFTAISAMAERCEVIPRDALPTRTDRGIPPGLSADAPPEWVQPLGAHDAYPLGFPVSHQGYTYTSLMADNVWEPSPQSTLWEIYPDPGPLPWKQPTGSTDAYSIGDVVTHEVAGRTETLWQSNIPSNTTEPGTDGTFDRWWKPLDSVPEVIPAWRQPVPGAVPAYRVGAQVTHQGSTWVNTFEQNVWAPGVFGWDVAGTSFAAVEEVQPEPELTKQQKLAAKRVRVKGGKFRADDPSTPDVNEAWLEG